MAGVGKYQMNPLIGKYGLCGLIRLLSACYPVVNVCGAPVDEISREKGWCRVYGWQQKACIITQLG
jgi:hypothetical protein